MLFFFWSGKDQSLDSVFSVAVIIGILLNYSIDKFNNPEHHQTLTIREIKEYQIGSTTIISGTDTTKTYTITYFK